MICIAKGTCPNWFCYTIPIVKGAYTLLLRGAAPTMSGPQCNLLSTVSNHDSNHPLSAAALAFAGIGFFDVGLAVFTGRLSWLAEKIVPCGPKQAARSNEQWVALLKERLQPVLAESPASGR